MLNMNYIGDSTAYSIEFNALSANIVELKGNFPVKEIGFVLSRPDHDDNWDYSTYTTVYREIDGGAQFSNDDSIYTPPEPEPVPIPNIPNVVPYKPTEEELKEMEQRRLEAQATPTNAELSAAVMELAENMSDIEDAIAELGSMIS